MDYSMKQKTNIIAAVCLIASAIYAGNQTFDQYRAWPEGNQIGPVYEQDFSTGDLKVFTAFPGYTIGKYGYNGSPGLRAERKPGEKYGFVSVTIPNLKPGKTYKVSMLCRGENIQGEPHGFCIEFYKKPGGQYIGGLYDAQPITNEWKKIERPFVLQEGQEARVSLDIRDNASGVLYYDNLQVEEVGNLWSVLPTRLTNLSLWTDDSSFELHAAIPEGAKNFAVLATLDLDGKRYEKLLKPDAKGFCSGDFGPLPAGHGKIDFTLLDMAAKRRLASSAYEINVRTRDAVSANTVTIDRDHRLIVDGKPFMPIGIYGAWQGSMKDEDLQRIADIKRIIPGCGITTDIFVGYHDETEEDHQETLSLVKEVGFDSAFMFKYSERPGTYAAKHLPDNVSEETKIARLNELIKLQTEVSAEQNKKDEGKVFTILIENFSKRSREQMMGRTEQNKAVVIDKGNHHIGEFVKVRITGSTSATLFGEEVKE